MEDPLVFSTFSTMKLSYNIAKMRLDFSGFWAQLSFDGGMQENEKQNEKSPCT